MEKLIAILQTIAINGKNIWSKYTLNSNGYIILSVLIGLILGIPVNLWVAKFSIGRGLIYFGIGGVIIHNLVLIGVMKEWWSLGWWGQLKKGIYSEIITPAYAWGMIISIVGFAGAFLASGHHFIYSMMLLVIISQVSLFRAAKVIK